MRTIRYRSQGSDVHFLEELLTAFGYKLYVSNYFGWDTHNAVIDFQQKNELVVDGIVGLKTWSKLLAAEKEFFRFNDKLLSEQDLIDFASDYDLELAAVKAVNAIESSGKGFLVDGRPKILFEGHIFWKQLQKRNINPEDLLNENSRDVLYKEWTKAMYLGGAREYFRLEKAASLRSSKEVWEAAYCSASWGSFQIMGYHYSHLGYDSIDSWVKKMYEHEREHLKAFGKYLEIHKLIVHLKNRNWVRFAEAYNGPGYRQNNYGEKLKAAYQRYLPV